MQQLNIVPVAISYEYDPGDDAKGKELYETSVNGSYQKGEFEDIESIVSGIVGYKGRVHVSVGQPLTNGFETPEELAVVIDKAIHQQYRLFASNQLAAKMEDKDITAEQRRFFEQRMASIDEKWRNIVNATYAKPAINQRDGV